MNEDTELQENVIDQVIEEAAPEVEGVEAQEPQEETRVPLSVVQKERRKRQDAEARENRIQAELSYYKEQMHKPAAPEEEDETQYESATKGEMKQSLASTQEETLRILEERLWKKANPEKAESVDENLAQFLKQRPNLASAVSTASNRYEEAYTLMEALSPKQQAQLKAPAVKRDAPGSPVGVPKGAAINEVLDVMSMTDGEYRAWRQSKRQRR